MARTKIHVNFSDELARNEEQTLMMKTAFRKNVKGFDVFAKNRTSARYMPQRNWRQRVRRLNIFVFVSYVYFLDITDFKDISVY